jgi:hypothetical protein
MGADGWLLKTDASGNEQWSKRYGTSNADWARAVDICADGGYVAAGATSSRKIWLFKTDASGTLMWDTTYGGSNSSRNDDAYAVHQTHDGGYIVGAYKIPSDNHYNKSDFWLVKTDAVGNVEWSKVINESWASHDYAYDAIQTTDGGYAICGHTQPSNVSSGSAWLIRTDAEGNVVLDTNFYEARTAYSIIQTNDRAYMLAGFANTDTTGNDVVLIKTAVDTMITDARSVNHAQYCKNKPYRIVKLKNGAAIDCGQRADRNISALVYNLKGRIIKRVNVYGSRLILDSFSGARGMHLIHIQIDNSFYADKFAAMK